MMEGRCKLLLQWGKIPWNCLEHGDVHHLVWELKEGSLLDAYGR